MDGSSVWHYLHGLIDRSVGDCSHLLRVKVIEFAGRVLMTNDDNIRNTRRNKITQFVKDKCREKGKRVHFMKSSGEHALNS